MPKSPWPEYPVDREHFKNPPRDYGILPFWFLNGELDPQEMLYQLREYQAKGMPGIILHGRYGLETEYAGLVYLERIRYAIEEAGKLGLKTWIYDEMNWPSGTADKRVLKARPDLAQQYIECLNFQVRGPWFTYLTGADSRYIDFERSKPVGAFAVSKDGTVIDLTPNLSFTNVIPWEAPSGNWRLMYIVEKEADYYIDALNPEATAEFLRQGYDPYLPPGVNKFQDNMLGFYTDEPAMHYFVTGGDNPIVPWTKDMFRRFEKRNGYNLRPRLPDLFFDIHPDSARIRNDFYNTLTEFYSDAYYRQIHDWCQDHGVLFTGHLLYEEWLRKLVRVEGNIFKHYAHMDVIGVDHLYPIIGNRDRPDEHVAMKVGSSASHQLGSQRLLCESFGGIFMDATMQRMKWIADWEYTLGVNLLNPHGFHYTLEGPRKRDWPPSQFYQYPWWRYYSEFSAYISRLSHMLSGGRHVAKIAVLWPIHSLFGTYIPQSHNSLADRTEIDFGVLTDLLLRLHYDFDYLDEDMLCESQINHSSVCIRDESYEAILLPPIAYLQIDTIAKLNEFVNQGGKLLGMVFLPAQAFGPDGLVDISSQIQALFGIDPTHTQRNYLQYLGTNLLEKEHIHGGKTLFLQTYALNRQLPLSIQQELGVPGHPESQYFVIEVENETSRYYYKTTESTQREITAEVQSERQVIYEILQKALNQLSQPDVIISNPEVFYLHRVKDGQDIYFLSNPTYLAQQALVSLTGQHLPVLWDPSTGEEHPLSDWQERDGRTVIQVVLPPAGSIFILTRDSAGFRTMKTNLSLDRFDGEHARGYTKDPEAVLVYERKGKSNRLINQAVKPYQELSLDSKWEFKTDSPNALVLDHWLSTRENQADGLDSYVSVNADTSGWLPMVPGAWSYQLPAEPDGDYPIPVWYRMQFQAGFIPSQLNLIVDGFAGSGWSLFVNGQKVDSQPVRSSIDSQMQVVDITRFINNGNNLIALRLVVTSPTDGLLDLLKLQGDFALELTGGEVDPIIPKYRIVPSKHQIAPASWTSQGYPYYSGQGIYCCTLDLPESFVGQRIFIEPGMYDDVLEVRVNGQTAGIRLWEPYTVEITSYLQSGRNSLELQVANTLVNLLEAVERPSGLAGIPKLVAYPSFDFVIPA